MNGAHLHILLNHFPVIGLVFTLGLLAAALYWHNDAIGRAGLVALVAIALVAIPVYLTGEAAEEVVEGFTFVSDEIIEPHEEAGLITFIALEGIGIIALLGLVVSRGKRLVRWLVPTALVMNLIAAAWIGYTAYLGGKIVHRESRPGFQPIEERHEEGER
jgi:uncharacterized membrane protein